MINTTIGDGQGLHDDAHTMTPVLSDKPGLVVYTDTQVKLQTAVRFLSSSDFGVNMNQYVGASGTADGVHDGTDTALWTGSVLAGASGAFAFDSSAQANGGTKSIDASASVNDNMALLTRASGTIDLDSYSALHGSIYITSWPVTGTKDVSVQPRLAAIDVGDPVDLGPIIDTGILNAWQNFIIPKTSFNLDGETIDELTISTIDIGGQPAPDYFLDDLAWEPNAVGTQAPIVYSLEAGPGEVLFVHNLLISIADDYPGTVVNASMPDIPFDSILGVAELSNGITIQRTNASQIIFSATVRNFLDLMQFAPTTVTSGSDGTNTWFVLDVVFDTPIVLRGNLGDVLTFTINDDLSDLLRFRVAARVLTELTE